MPMAYIYGKKFVGPITPTILAIRNEIYNIPYNEINWSKARSSCAKVCYYSVYPFKHQKLYDFLYSTVSLSL